MRHPHHDSAAVQNSGSSISIWVSLVLVTKFRAPLFDKAIAPGLFDYVLAVGRKHGFAVDRMSLLPDHMCLLGPGMFRLGLTLKDHEAKALWRPLCWVLYCEAEVEGPRAKALWCLLGPGVFL